MDEERARVPASGGLTFSILSLKGGLGGYEIKMPGSLSNEDEGQDDMDFEDDMPGEVKEGEAGCPSRYFFFFLRRYALNAGEKGLSCVPGNAGEGGVARNKHSHATIMIFYARLGALGGGNRGSYFLFLFYFPSLCLQMLLIYRAR